MQGRNGDIIAGTIASAKAIVSAAQELLRFGVFELNLSSEELRKSGVILKLPPQPFRLLALLASHAGQVVTRDTIQSRLWGEGTEVDSEHGMRQCINQIRTALGDDSENPVYVETIPRQGYRFLPPVVSQRVAEPRPQVKEASNTELVNDIASQVLAKVAASVAAQTAADGPAATNKAPASESAAAAQPPGNRQTGKKMLVVASVLILGAGVGFLVQRLIRENLTPHRETLVVLPFEAAEQDTASNALARGLSESITGKLVQAHHGSGLELISAREARDMGVKTADDARRRLKTDYVLEGSVQYSGQKVQVSCSLVDSRTHRQIGARTVTGDTSELFALEDQVVGQILGILPGENAVSEPGMASAATQPPGYQAYLRGRGYLLEYEKPENIDSAIADFNHALEMYPNFALAHAGLGQAYWIGYDLFHKGREWLDQSSSQCQEAVRLDSNLAEAHTCIGTFYNASGQYEKAVQEFRRSVELDAKDELTWRGLGRAYDKLDKASEAESAYKKAVELHPHYWAVYSWLGGFYFKRAHYSEAIDIYRKAIELAPDNHRLYASLGGIYVQIGRYEDAIVELRRSIELRPTMEAYSNLGVAYFYTHRYTDAAETFRKAAFLDDKDWVNWGNLGDALYWIPGRRHEAAQAYQTALELAAARLRVNPNDASIAADVAVDSAMLDDKSAALTNIKRALALDPDDGDLLFRASLVYNHFGDTDETLSLLKQAVEHGFPVATVQDTPDFDHLRSNPAYSTLIAKK